MPDDDTETNWKQFRHRWSPAAKLKGNVRRASTSDRAGIHAKPWEEASIPARLYAACRHLYRWWRPPRRGSAVRLASATGLGSIGRPLGVSLLRESWTRSSW